MVLNGLPDIPDFHFVFMSLGDEPQTPLTPIQSIIEFERTICLTAESQACWVLQKEISHNYEGKEKKCIKLLRSQISFTNVFKCASVFVQTLYATFSLGLKQHVLKLISLYVILF